MKRLAKNTHRSRSARQLVRIALRKWETDAGWRAIVELQMRGVPSTLVLARSLSVSPSSRRRALGMYIASQLLRRRGPPWSTLVPFALAETQALLLAGLHDLQDEVVLAAISGFGHRPHPAALPDLVRLSTHSDARLRFNVAIALGRYAQPAAVEALLGLAADPEDDVRDWATFGLGTLLDDIDTLAIRERLWKNLHDADSDVRREALAGLAERGDPRAIDYLLGHPEEEGYELAAAEELATTLPPATRALPSTW